jgi:hypothetical protein
MTRIARRGIDEEDNRWFSENAVSKMKIAQEEVAWLLDRGYDIDPVMNFIGGHYQFSQRQRIALKRATGSKIDCEKRKASLLHYSEAKDKAIYIDGFNLIINLEVALSGGILIIGNDGTMRDLAGLRGTYSIIDKTEKAIELIGEEFKELNVAYAKFFLDAPVSNSGRLKSRILEHAEGWDFDVEVELVPNADPILWEMERVVTSDSEILNNCVSWFNMSRKIVFDYIKDARIVNLSRT